MKKLFLALMALMASVTANAEAFDLWIAGTQVTTENQDDVLGDGSVIYYNNSNHKLIIKDVTIQGGEFPAIKSGLDCTTICIKGNVTLEGAIGRYHRRGINILWQYRKIHRQSIHQCYPDRHTHQGWHAKSFTQFKVI